MISPNPKRCTHTVRIGGSSLELEDGVLWLGFKKLPFYFDLELTLLEWNIKNDLILKRRAVGFWVNPYPSSVPNYPSIGSQNL